MGGIAGAKLFEFAVGDALDASKAFFFICAIFGVRRSVFMLRLNSSIYNVLFELLKQTGMLLVRFHVLICLGPEIY